MDAMIRLGLRVAGTVLLAGLAVVAILFLLGVWLAVMG